MESIPSLYPQLEASGLLQEAQPKRKQVKRKQSRDAAAFFTARICFDLTGTCTGQDGARLLVQECLVTSAVSDIRVSISYHVGGHKRGGHGGQ